MADNTTTMIIRHGVAALAPEEIDQWMKLYRSCFNTNFQDAISTFEKYRLHPESAVFCLGLAEGQVAACYSGIILHLNEIKIFLSTDTMSSGQIKNATAKLGKHVYAYLRGLGVQAVCGFPNKNIVKIREKKLDWKIIGSLNAYVGIPIVWRFFRRVPNSLSLWYLKRPEGGYFDRRRPFFTLLGRSRLYKGGYFTLVFTLSATSPGLFFIKVPGFILEPKVFGYVLLDSESPSVSDAIAAASKQLDLNTIDVP